MSGRPGRPSTRARIEPRSTATGVSRNGVSGSSERMSAVSSKSVRASAAASVRAIWPPPSAVAISERSARPSTRRSPSARASWAPSVSRAAVPMRPGPTATAPMRSAVSSVSPLPSSRMAPERSAPRSASTPSSAPRSSRAKRASRSYVGTSSKRRPPRSIVRRPALSSRPSSRRVVRSSRPPASARSATPPPMRASLTELSVSVTSRSAVSVCGSKPPTPRTVPWAVPLRLVVRLSSARKAPRLTLRNWVPGPSTTDGLSSKGRPLKFSAKPPPGMSTSPWTARSPFAKVTARSAPSMGWSA